MNQLAFLGTYPFTVNVVEREETKPIPVHLGAVQNMNIRDRKGWES